MGFIAAQDCELGLTLSHGGGYPGYGSHVLLLPDYGIGIFAFANRTYAGPRAAGVGRGGGAASRRRADAAPDPGVAGADAPPTPPSARCSPPDRSPPPATCWR